MYVFNNSPLENYFPNQDSLLQIDTLSPSVITNPQGDKIRQHYEFIPYHPVSVSSEMAGTTIEELVMHNFPTKQSWENSRLGAYPEEVIMRLNHRSEIRYILLRSKINRPIPLVVIHIGDGVFGNFNDTKYVKTATAQNINEEGSIIKVDGIGNYIKFVFPHGNMRTLNNPFGQISIAQLKLFGKRINHLIYYDEDTSLQEEQKKNSNIDQILIQMGLPINDEYSLVQDQNYEIAPVDEETKITIRDMLEICRRAEFSKDYEILRSIKKDIRLAFYLGNSILNCDRELKIAVAKDDYDKCIELRKRRNILSARRDNLDVIYETSRYEKMILLDKITPDDILANEERARKMREEQLEKERREQQMRDEEEQRRLREREEKERLANKKIQEDEQEIEEIKKTIGKDKDNNHPSNRVVRFRDGPSDSKFKYSDQYVSQKEIQKKEEFVDELQYNQGDKDLEPFFNPRANAAGGIIPAPDINKLRRAQRQGILNVMGVRLFSSLIGSDWKMREAAVRAFLEYIENPLLPRYINKTYPLFQACIEIAKFAADDKVIQIYLEGLQILKLCLSPPVCGNDIDPTYIQKSINYFLPIYIKKISEFNDKQRDLTMDTIISIFKHPALNVGDLVKACLDIVENNRGISPDKQPWNILLARLEIILHILEEYGINEDLWDWYVVFVELILPSLFHQKPDCRLIAEEICVLLYKYVGSDVRNIINDLNNLKQNLKEKLNMRMNKIDETTNLYTGNNVTNKADDINKVNGGQSGNQIKKKLTIIQEDPEKN